MSLKKFFRLNLINLVRGHPPRAPCSIKVRVIFNDVFFIYFLIFSHIFFPDELSLKPRLRIVNVKEESAMVEVVFDACKQAPSNFFTPTLKLLKVFYNEFYYEFYMFNTQNMTNPTIVSPVKMEYG